jgi:carbon storage regulator
MDTFSSPKIDRGRQLHQAAKISFECYLLRKLRNLRNFPVSFASPHSLEKIDRGVAFIAQPLLGMAGKPEVKVEISGLRCSPGLNVVFTPSPFSPPIGRPYRRATISFLTFKEDEKILIGDKITVMLVEIRGNQVRLGIEAPDEVLVLREKLAGEAKS